MKSLSYTVFLNFKNTVWDDMNLEYSASYTLEVVPGFNQGFLVRRFHPLMTSRDNNSKSKVFT
jgi:hypothetical protein